MTAMTTTAHEVATSTATGHDDYVLGRTQEEYERLRAQARGWAQATGRLLDQVELARGARCLDAGCGPGETMRQLAQRVGPAGEVVGVDVDAALGAQAVDLLHAAGHRQCSFAPVDLERREPIQAHPSTWSTPGCCSSTCPTRSPCCGACGTRSRRAAT